MPRRCLNPHFVHRAAFAMRVTAHRRLLAGFLSLLVSQSALAATKKDATLPKSPPTITVIYPRPKQSIGPVDSMFILGSVTPGAKLTVNGVKVFVYRTGGFLAFVPVHPGQFVFRLKASNQRGNDTLSLPVQIADVRPIPSDSGAMIRKETIRPMWRRTVRAGDDISVGFDGTAGGAAFFRVLSPTDTLGPYAMTELRPENLSDFAAFQQDDRSQDSLPEIVPKPPSRGRYHGIWRVPDVVTSDSLRIAVELHRGHGTGTHESDSVAFATAPGALRPVDADSPRVVELLDSVQILRLGPRMGYLSIFQPYGVRARWWGEAGPWTIIQPAPGYEAWIETAKTRLLPDGTPLPGSSIERIATKAAPSGGGAVELVIGTSERLPFKITVDDDLVSMHLLIFGATSNTDWIEQDPKDDLIDHISWTQIQPQVYEVDAHLKLPVWGYDAHYEDTRLVVRFRRPPVVRKGLKGLTIVVDAGHSADPGAIGPTGLMEKDANLQLALAVRDVLQARGARVVMTRSGNENVPLYDRPVRALAGGGDIFVSIHNNASPDGINPLIHNGSAVYYYHPFSRDLAESVHRRLLPATHLDDFGLTQGNFAVIRPTQYPAILVECTFIIVPEQEELLTQRAFIKRTARGIADGIGDFIRGRLSQ